MPFWYLIYIQQTQIYAKGIAGSLGEQSFKKLILITLNYAQKYDIFFPFFTSSTKVRRIFYDWYDAFTKKNYFQLECCDSIFSLLSRALEYINSAEVLARDCLKYVMPFVNWIKAVFPLTDYAIKCIANASDIYKWNRFLYRIVNYRWTP